MRQFFAHFLFLLSAWTLTIKWILPVVWAIGENAPLTTYIWWDFWWVVHIWLGCSLLFGSRYLLGFVYIVSILEICIVVTKFGLFFSSPEWSMWTMNWFVNKVFVLICFVMLLSHAVVRKGDYTATAR